MARLFFAIWPEAAAARELAQVAQSLAALAGGRSVPAGKIHMTLAFLGSLDEEAIASAMAAAAGVEGVPISMTLDLAGSFRRARVAWAAPSQPVAELVALQGGLADALRSRGFELEDRAFTPHATLARKIDRRVPNSPMPPVQWRSRALTLVESTGDGRYEVVESWGLRGT